MKAALLPDRGVVKVDGDGAEKFLNGLVTAEVSTVTSGRAAFAALLTPQGKIIADFIVARIAPEDGGILPRLPARARQDAGRPARLLQAARQGDVEDLSETLGVLAAWDGDRHDRVRPGFSRSPPARRSACA